MRGFTVHIEDTQPTEAEAIEGAYLGRERARSAGGVEDASGQGPLSEPACSENVHGSGQVVDQYRIVKLLAVGGTARVYEAVHEFTRKPVALKIMRNRLAERRDVRERFRQEAMVLASIRHENVVAVDNAGLTDDGRVFLAMELLRGLTLRELLVQRGRLSLEDTLRVLLEVASGVSAAHEAGVTHRDLKPENIFCSSHGSFKVLDLGTAKYAGENAPSLNTAFGRIIGTVAYVAPERFKGVPADARSDIYALGLIAYECLAGFHPIVPDGKWPSAAEIASRQVTYDPSPIRGVPTVVWAIVDKAIQKAPNRRFQSVAEMLRALRAADKQVRAGDASRCAALQANMSSGGSLKQPIVAGLLFGMIAAGSAQSLRVFHSNRAPAAVSGRNSEISSSTERLEPQEAVPAHAVPRPRPTDGDRREKTGGQPVGESSANPASSVAVNSVSIRRRLAQAQPDGHVTPSPGSAATGSLVGRLIQGTAPAGTGAYDSAPTAKAPKDDLPASGL